MPGFFVRDRPDRASPRKTKKAGDFPARKPSWPQSAQAGRQACARGPAGSGRRFTPAQDCRFTAGQGSPRPVTVLWEQGASGQLVRHVGSTGAR